MEPSTISLKMTTDSTLLPAAPEPEKSRYQQFTFSKNFERAQLSQGFAQKFPSPIVTALNVTRIAPAVFFAVEKFAQALQAVLNAGSSLLHCACGCLFDKEIVVMEAPKPTKSIEEKPVDKTPIQKIVDKAAFTIGLPATPPVDVSEETPAEEPATPVAADDVTPEEPASPAPADAVDTVEPTPTPVEVEEPAEAPKDGLDKYDDLLLVNDEPVVPQAPSNTTRNLLIGGGLAVAGGIVYGALSHLNVLPSISNPFNFFSGNTPTVTSTEIIGTLPEINGTLSNPDADLE